MNPILIAMGVSLVLNFIAGRVVKFYMELGLSDKQLDASFTFNLFVVLLMITSTTFWVCITLTLAWVAKVLLF